MDRSTGTISVLAKELKNPTGICANDKDEFIFADGEEIKKLNTNGEVETYPLPKGSWRYGVALDNSNNIFTTDHTTGKIEKFDTNGNYSVICEATKDLTDIIFDQHGTMVTSQWISGHILVWHAFAKKYIKLECPDYLQKHSRKYSTSAPELSPNGNKLLTFYYPGGVCFDKIGNLYVAETSTGDIWKIDKSIINDGCCWPAIKVLFESKCGSVFKLYLLPEIINEIILRNYYLIIHK